jgi:hypothetical protein
MNDLEKAINDERVINGKKTLKKPATDKEKKVEKESITDPNSEYMHKDGKPNEFHYPDYRTVDIKYNIITDVDPYLERLNV